MKYAALIEYCTDRERIQAVRPAHRQYLAELRQRGQLAASGPFADDTGAMIIYEACDAAEAEALLRADPFYLQGVFVRYRLYPWNVVLANRELFPG